MGLIGLKIGVWLHGAYSLEMAKECSDDDDDKTVTCFNILDRRTVGQIDHVFDRTHVVLCSGLDLTCSAVDSCALLNDIAIIESSKTVTSNRYESLSDGMLLDNRDVRSSLQGQYVGKYEQCIDKIMHNEKVMEFNFETLCIALGEL
ncbi:unnamed protein product [Lactuca saligna]|uniref:Uncharacterized protein n=1 Tax=Lactuca saligna TaxID=75948 RepID=A0AA35ZUH4_LACSI|nr:unnamed protein product [Lactuca saligna]